MSGAYIQIDAQGVNVHGVLDACARLERRRSWLAVALASLLVLAVGVGGVAWWTATAERDLLRGELDRAQIWLGETETRNRCLRALLNHAPPTRAEIVTVAERADWMASCVKRELERAS